MRPTTLGGGLPSPWDHPFQPPLPGVPRTWELPDCRGFACPCLSQDKHAGEQKNMTVSCPGGREKGRSIPSPCGKGGRMHCRQERCRLAGRAGLAHLGELFKMTIKILSCRDQRFDPDPGTPLLLSRALQVQVQSIFSLHAGPTHATLSILPPALPATPAQDALTSYSCLKP